MGISVVHVDSMAIYGDLWEGSFEFHGISLPDKNHDTWVYVLD